jgi:hypothetical protein
LTEGKIELSCRLQDVQQLKALRAQGVPAPLFRLVEVWLRKEFAEQMASNKHKACPMWDKKRDGPGAAERTVNTGLSRGALIPTPNLSGKADQAQRVPTQAQQDRLAWQMQQNGTATVCNDDEGEGLFTAGLPSSAP